MGDKSRKSKQRDENQKKAAKAKVVREAKAKQDLRAQLPKTAKVKK